MDKEEFELQKKIIELEIQKKIIELEMKKEKTKHGFNMQELEFVRGTEKLRHEQSLEFHRIKSAEIRKAMERKERLNEEKRFLQNDRFN